MPELKACFDSYEAFPGKKLFCKFINSDDGGCTCELSGVDSNAALFIAGKHSNEFGDDDVKSVIIKKSDLTKIPEEIFQIFKNVENLSGKNSNMEKVDEKTLKICGNLKRIDLSGNKISLVGGNAFESCTNLTSINLSENKISFLPSKLFNKNLKLESIYFDRNIIQSIDPCNNVIRFQLKHLQLLSLKWNICINNSFKHSILHLLFNQIAFRDIKVCYAFFFL